MESDREERLYSRALRMVLWGEERDEVFRTLEVNGIIGHQADVIYLRARKERVSTIRGAYFQKAILGLIMLAGGIALYSVFWLIIGVMFNFILVGSGILGMLGAYKFLDGVFGVFYAPYKKGSVTEEF